VITVFIGTFNRLDTLERTIGSYRRFGDYELVIVDNGSWHPDCVRLLAEIEKLPEVAKIYSLPASMDMNDLSNNFVTAIDDWRSQTKSKWFAVSEADVSFDGADQGALDAYVALAEETGRAVGPHLCVDDIPHGYPLRNRVLSCESRLLYRESMTQCLGIYYSPWQIDTTFHLFPRHQSFRRLHMDTVRVGPPYAAKHLDWYLDIHNPTDENRIYIHRVPGVGSWGRQWIADYWLCFQESGAEAAFELLSRSPLNKHGDLCINSFLLSWCYQHGVGCEQDRGKSVWWLHNAIPRPTFNEYRVYEGNWEEMIYEDRFECLGWS
jgi:hypothetical protein